MRTIALQRKEVHRTPLFWEFTHSAYPTAAGRKPLCGLLITDRRSIPCLHCLEIKMQNPITHGYFLMLCRSLRYTYTVQYIILSKEIAFFRALCEGCCLSQTLFCSQIECCYFCLRQTTLKFFYVLLWDLWQYTEQETCPNKFSVC